MPFHRRGAETWSGEIANAPGIPEVVFRPSADVRWEVIVIHPNHFIPLAPPAWQGMIDGMETPTKWPRPAVSMNE